MKFDVKVERTLRGQRYETRGADWYLREYEKIFGKTNQDVLTELGKAVAKGMASNTQPLGLSAKVGKKYRQSIMTQAHRAIKAANVAGTPGAASEAHRAYRDNRGRVPKGLKTSGQFQRKPVEIDERMAYAEKQADKAGMAKGAWIAAGDAIDGKMIPRIPKWIRKHAKRGSAKITVKKFAREAELELENELFYVAGPHFASEIPKVMRAAYKSQFYRMRIVIEKFIEKAQAAENK